jgi:thiamine monophosphate kinase
MMINTAGYQFLSLQSPIFSNLQIWGVVSIGGVADTCADRFLLVMIGGQVTQSMMCRRGARAPCWCLLTFSLTGGSAASRKLIYQRQAYTSFAYIEAKLLNFSRKMSIFKKYSCLHII